VEVAALVRVADLGRVDGVHPVALRDGGRDVVVQPLERVAHVAVFADLPVELLEVAVDEGDVGLGGDLTQALVLVTVNDEGARGAAEGGFEQHLLGDVLHLLDGGDGVGDGVGEEVDDADGEALGDVAVVLAGGGAGALQGVGDAGDAEGDDAPVAFADLGGQAGGAGEVGVKILCGCRQMHGGGDGGVGE